MDIKLTPAERLILANQYQILGHLHQDPEALSLAENLRNGYEYMYRDIMESMSPEMDKDATDFVLDALSLFQALQDSWITLGEPASIKAKDVEWPGFDGNNEGRFYGFTRALAADNRFPEQLGSHGRNSHSAKVATYQRMLKKWKEQGEPRHPMTIVQIQEILAARGY